MIAKVCRMMQILSFPIFQLQEMNLQSCGEWCAVSIGQVWFRTSHVICYCYVIISSCTVHEAENVFYKLPKEVCIQNMLHGVIIMYQKL